MKTRNDHYSGRGIIVALVAVFMIMGSVMFISSETEAANYKRLAAKWQKIGGTYYKEKLGAIMCKKSVHSKQKKIYYGELKYAYANGKNVCLCSYDGYGNPEFLKMTNSGKRIGKEDVCIRSGREDGSANAEYTGKIKKLPFLGQRGNRLYFTSDETDKNTGFANIYIRSYDMTSEKVRSYFIGFGDYPMVTITTRYIYGQNSGTDISDKDFYIYDRRTNKVKRLKSFCYTYKVKGNKIYYDKVSFNKKNYEVYKRYSMSLNGRNRKYLGRRVM